LKKIASPFCNYRIFATCLFFECTKELIIVNDPDGFVNVRDGKRSDAVVIDSIKTSTMLYCVQDGTP
jgi:hypothetical protein